MIDMQTFVITEVPTAEELYLLGSYKQIQHNSRVMGILCEELTIHTIVDCRLLLGLNGHNSLRHCKYKSMNPRLTYNARTESQEQFMQFSMTPSRIDGAK